MPVGQEPLPCDVELLLCPAAKVDNNFCKSELLHFSQTCLRGSLCFSRNSVICPQFLHLYSNIGIFTPHAYKALELLVIVFSTFLSFPELLRHHLHIVFSRPGRVHAGGVKIHLHEHVPRRLYLQAHLWLIYSSVLSKHFRLTDKSNWYYSPLPIYSGEYAKLNFTDNKTIIPIVISQWAQSSYSTTIVMIVNYKC